MPELGFVTRFDFRIMGLKSTMDCRKYSLCRGDCPVCSFAGGSQPTSAAKQEGRFK